MRIGFKWLALVILASFPIVSQSAESTKYQLISQHLAELSQKEQKLFIDESVRQIQNNQALEKFRNLIGPKSPCVAVAHSMKGKFASSEFVGAIPPIYGALPEPGTDVNLIGVEYTQPWTSTYAFYFKRDRTLMFVVCLPEG